MSTPRIAPIEPPFDPEAAAELARWMPRDSPAPPLALFRTLARDLPLARAMHPLGSFLLSRRLSIGLRTREIAIHRVCARLGCEYEWGVHAAFFGAAAGLDPAALRATATGEADDAAWSAEEALVVRTVDALCETGNVPDALHRELAARWSPEQILELVVLVGWYHVIAFVCNAAGVEGEAWAERFPEAPAPLNR